MSELVNILPVLGAIVLGAILIGAGTKPEPTPVPVRAKRPRR